jgi:uncharacterized membrane protein
MEQWLSISAGYVGFAVETMAVVIIAIGSIKAFFEGLGVLFRHSTHDDMRNVWLDYARYLIAGLTFQLASDIVSTTVAPTWDDIGRLAAIAVTRTFLSYFLERDLEGVRSRRLRTSEVPDGQTSVPAA